MDKIYVVYNMYGANYETPTIFVYKAYHSKDEAEKVAEEKEQKDKKNIVDTDYGIDYSHWYVGETELE